MVSSIESSGISQLQLLRANQAFKATTVQKPQQPEIQDVASISAESQNITQKVATSPIDVRNKRVADEVNKYMSQFKECNLSEKDVNYALRFGRSVLVDYSA